MTNITSEIQIQPTAIKATCKLKSTAYRGFTSIDQEMEREIAMQFFYPVKKNSFSRTGILTGKL